MDGRTASDRHGRLSGRGFTLIEVLVVIGVVALLVALILPAMAGARRASQLAVSQINLKQCGDVQATYAADFKGSFVNPFYGRLASLPNVGWYMIVAAESFNTPANGPIYVYDYGHPAFCTHLFGATWASFVTQYITTTNLTSKMLLSPLDTTAVARFQKELPEELAAGTFFGDRVWDTSYWCPPTLWLGPESYRTANRASIGFLDFRYWRRNRFDDAVSPQAKAMVFERFDFSRRTRPHLAGGRERFFPTFNNPEAVTRFVSVDGSVTSFPVAKLFKLTNPATASQAEMDMYTPAGPFEIPDSVLGDPQSSVGQLHQLGLGRDGLENGDGTMLGIQGGLNRYPGFFWATRNGIQGRDIPR